MNGKIKSILYSIKNVKSKVSYVPNMLHAKMHKHNT